MSSAGWRSAFEMHRGNAVLAGPARCAAWAEGMLVPCCVLGWLAVLLILDRHASLAGQAVLGVTTWLVVGAIGHLESVPVRIQVAVVVLFATAVEYTFSGWLGVYTYRLGNVPAFVPPGHALVYLGALSLSRSWLFRRHVRLLVALTVASGGAYAGWSLVSSRPDLLGAAWFVCLLGFLRWGRSASLFTAVFVVVTALELWGTHLGTWTWQPLDPTGHVTIGNPPSGVAGGYGWFDLAAVLATPRLIGWFHAQAPALPVGGGGAAQGSAPPAPARPEDPGTRRRQWAWAVAGGRLHGAGRRLHQCCHRSWTPPAPQ